MSSRGMSGSRTWLVFCCLVVHRLVIGSPGLSELLFLLCSRNVLFFLPLSSTAGSPHDGGLPLRVSRGAGVCWRSAVLCCVLLPPPVVLCSPLLLRSASLRLFNSTTVMSAFVLNSVFPIGPS